MWHRVISSEISWYHIPLSLLPAVYSIFVWNHWYHVWNLMWSVNTFWTIPVCVQQKLTIKQDVGFISTYIMSSVCSVGVRFYVIYLWWGAKDELRSLSAWETKLLCSLAAQRPVLLYLLPDDSRVNSPMHGTWPRMMFWLVLITPYRASSPGPCTSHVLL